MPSFGPRNPPQAAHDLETAWRNILTGPPDSDIASIRATLSKYIVPDVEWYISGKKYSFDDIVKFTQETRAKQKCLNIKIMEYMRNGDVISNKHIINAKRLEDDAFVDTECMQFLTVDKDGMITKVMEMSKDLPNDGMPGLSQPALGHVTWPCWYDYTKKLFN